MGTRIREGAEVFISKWFHSKGSATLGKHSPKFQLICDEDGVLYSYGTHFPLAKFEDKHGLPHILVNMKESTMTTNGHRSNVLGHMNKECAVRCENTLDGVGAIRRHDSELTRQLNHLHRIRKDLGPQLFKYAVDPSNLLLDGDGALACYLGVKGAKIHDKKEFAKVLLKYVPPGSYSRMIASLVLNKKDPTWEVGDHTDTDNFLKALFNKKGYKEDSKSVKWLTHFHAVGAAVIAAQICSEDGGAAVRLMSNSEED